MKTKYYGIFDVCYDTRYGKENLALRKVQLAARAVEKPHDTWGDRSKKVWEDRFCYEIKATLQSMRDAYNYDRKLSRCHRFKTVYFIHETDKDGWFLPNKKETEAAMKLLEERKRKTEEAEKQKQENDINVTVSVDNSHLSVIL